jgi:phosphohistidine phosphatase
MRLIVLRHGKAEPRADSGADADRALTERGTRQAEHVAEALKATPLRPDRIVTSPIRRALETARIVQRRLADAGIECPFELARGLETDRGLGAALDVIAENADVPVLLIVGHNPQLESLVVRASAGGIPGRAEVLKTGQGVVLEVPDPRAVIGGAECVEVIRLDGD